MCSNAVSKVQNKRVLSTLINPIEEAIRLKTPNLKELVHEEFREALIHSVQVTDRQEEPHANSSRLKRLEEALRTDHLNSEKMGSLVAICQKYTDIFFLEGDRVSATTADTGSKPQKQYRQFT